MKKTNQIKSIRCGCGGEAKLLFDKENGFYVRCDKCFLGTHFYPTERDAIEAFVSKWDGRISSPDEKLGQ